MADRKKERVQVVSQERLAEGIYSMWLRTEAAGTARAGQFISMYTDDAGKLLPRPISICEIDRENGRLRVVYRVTGENTGTEQFSKLGSGDSVDIIGPLGNGFPTEKKYSLWGEALGSLRSWSLPDRLTAGRSRLSWDTGIAKHFCGKNLNSTERSIYQQRTEASGQKEM